jgi:hypothetical protein
MSLTDLIGAALVIEVALVIPAVIYIIRVYLESRRNAQGKVPRLYSIIAGQAAIKALAGIAIAAVLVAFWSGIDTRGWGSVVIGLVVLLFLSTPIAYAAHIWQLRQQEDDE